VNGKRIGFLTHLTTSALRLIKVVLIVSNNPTDRQIEDALIELAKVHEIQILRTYYLAPSYLSRYSDRVREILEESYHMTRVYILLVDTHAVADMARHLHSSDHIQAPEYILIAVEDEEFYDPSKKHQYFNNYFSQLERKELSSTNGQLHTPFRSVLLLTPSPPKNANYSQFCELVNQRSHERPFNVPMHPLIKPQVPIYAALAYDAVLLFARALTKVLANGESIHNGTAVIHYILNQTYESKFQLP
jgi:guanylate cyclase